MFVACFFFSFLYEGKGGYDLMDYRVNFCIWDVTFINTVKQNNILKITDQITYHYNIYVNTCYISYFISKLKCKTYHKILYLFYNYQ